MRLELGYHPPVGALYSSTKTTKDMFSKLGMVALFCTPSTGEAGAGRVLDSRQPVTQGNTRPTWAKSKTILYMNNESSGNFLEELVPV